MPQDSFNAKDIIVSAFEMLNVFSVHETPSSPDISRGLKILNESLDAMSYGRTAIPFTKKIEFDLVAGQDTYSFSNVTTADIDSERIVGLDFVNVLESNISYPVKVVNRAFIFNTTRTVDYKYRPSYAVLLRSELQTSIQFFPVPQKIYPAIVRAKFMIDHVNIAEVFTQVPVFYRKYLRYEVAKELKNYYQMAKWTGEMEKEYQELKKEVKSGGDLNLTIRGDNLLEPYYRDSYDYWSVA